MELETGYSEILQAAVLEIRTARGAIARQINTAAIGVYWNLGKLLSERKIEKGHGASVVERLSLDLKLEFPDMGLSPRNLWNMKRFFERFRNADPKLQRCVAVLPWRHNLLFLEKELSDDQVLFYAQKSIENHWTRDLLLNHLKANTYLAEQQQNKSHNFDTVLPALMAGQAAKLLKNKYNLGFLGLTETIKESELERRLIEKIKHFVLELGKGFTFISNQHRLEYNAKEHFVDILLYHRGLRCLIALELKIGAFKPEYAGKMNFYLGLLDKLEKQAEENPSIGIILCADKDHLDVEIALQDIHKPIGVAEYQLLLPTKELEIMLLDELRGVNIEKGGDDE